MKSPLSFNVSFVVVYFVKKRYSLNCVDDGELCFVKNCMVCFIFTRKILFLYVYIHYMDTFLLHYIHLCLLFV